MLEVNEVVQLKGVGVGTGDVLVSVGAGDCAGAACDLGGFEKDEEKAVVASKAVKLVAVVERLFEVVRGSARQVEKIDEMIMRLAVKGRSVDVCELIERSFVLMERKNRLINLNVILQSAIDGLGERERRVAGAMRKGSPICELGYAERTGVRLKKKVFSGISSYLLCKGFDEEFFAREYAEFFSAL